jgi:hypothetical protein
MKMAMTPGKTIIDDISVKEKSSITVLDRKTHPEPTCNTLLPLYPGSSSTLPSPSS